MRTRSFVPGPPASSAPPAAAFQPRPFEAEPEAARGAFPSRGFGSEAPQPAGSGRALPEGVRGEMESAFGVDFSRVRVHESDAPGRIGAEAFTRGEHIHFARGRFRPASTAGRGVLGHELAHVFQQRARRVAAPRHADLPVNVDRALEAEAAYAGTRVALGRPVALRGVAPASGPSTAPISPLAHSAAPAQAAPVQCLRTAGAFAEAMQGAGADVDHEHLAGMRDALARYHADRGEKSNQEYADHRAQALDDAEHHAYRYFGTIKAQGAAGGKRRHMLDMLDEIQAAHVEHTDTVHQGNLRLWTPDRATLGQGQREQLDADWDQLRGHTAGGLVQLPADQQGSRELRAMHARLLSRTHGRSLLHELNTREDQNDERTITHQMHARGTEDDADLRRRHHEVVRPLADEAEGTYQQALAAARQRSPDTGEEALRNADPALMRLHERRVDAGDRSMESGGAVAEAPDVYFSHDPARASQAMNRTGGPEGKGRGSTVHLMRGLRDSENLVPDAAGDMVPSPAYVTYGHELIHALHNRKANSDPTTTPERYAPNGDLAHFHRREEHITIDESRQGEVTENMLRDEHDITRRHGHSSTTREELERPQVVQERNQRMAQARVEERQGLQQREELRERQRTAARWRRNLKIAGAVGGLALAGIGLWRYLRK